MNASRPRIGSLSLRSKILLMILPLSLLSMALMAVIGYSTAADGLTRQAFAELTAIRASKKQQIETYFRTLRGTFSSFGDDLGVASAAQALTEGFNQLGRQKLSPERAKALAAFYRDDFVPRLNKIPGFEDITADQLIPHGDRAAEAQSLFIVENPNPRSERAKLLDSPVSNPYTLAHFTYHGWLRDLVDRLKISDLYLVSDKGQIVYSVDKDVDFGTNLIDGPYATTNMARLYRQIMDRHHKGYVGIVDYDFYMPSLGAPSLFIGTPIYVNFRLIGVLIGELSVDELNTAMSGDRSWREDGLGETGFAYVTGAEHLLRNDHRIFIERPDAFLATAGGQGYRPAEIDAIRRNGTAVLRYRMNTEGVRRAVLGETGTVTALNSRGGESLQAYAPLDIPDLKWVLNANIEREEILAPLDALKRTGLVLAGILTLVCTGFAVWIAGRFERPINALIAGTEAIKAGRTDVHVPVLGADEFGRLAASFNTMADAIRDRDAIIEAKNKAYAGLLTRVFPEVVAERLRAGEEQIVDTLPDVTLVCVSVVGFVEAIEPMEGAESVKLLNDILDRIDTLAEHHGMEPVKNIGEHYFAACGLTVPRLDHAARAIEFADAVAGEIRLIAAEHGLELSMRAAVASGEVHAGLVGSSRFVYDVWGKPLNVVRGLLQSAGIDEIRITAAVFNQLGTDSGFEPRPAAESAVGEIACFGRAAILPAGEAARRPPADEAPREAAQ
ncbi:adenylate/guanylate cyclase domain-containing protein [Methylobacterium sp. NEAU 140]|uniref:adenylate/guanylate cyclase domain-containing protein n=1 Tax=Methylobacterium sp. NEAU 140 TaxID=3064945 RepID=UPI002737737D|nr:adenylate/guanylate cyclase domain-containing protein [Methylobacterium sp. NEAU 140]MDP4021888.1 adenylate/guanylate cyclase domain-containing protein [Methylobacterium sp. NEAU 140]